MPIEKVQTLLIMEDDAVIRGMYQTKFANAGYEVIEGCDGEEGELLALEKHPDLILLDLELPKKDGMKVLESIRKTEWGEKVPVLIFTNLDADNDKLQSIVDLHPAYYINKSNSTPEEILEKIQEVLAEREGFEPPRPLRV